MEAMRGETIGELGCVSNGHVAMVAVYSNRGRSGKHYNHVVTQGFSAGRNKELPKFGLQPAFVNNDSSSKSNKTLVW